MEKQVMAFKGCYRRVYTDINFILRDYEEDLKQMRALTKKEFVPFLHREISVISRRNATHRSALALHKGGQRRTKYKTIYWERLGGERKTVMWSLEVVEEDVAMVCVVRTARTVKNKGKEFWGCPKFKNGGEGGGCNYFKWCADHGVVETETSAKCEGKCESFLKREAMEDGWKIKSDLDLSVKKLENRLNIVLGIGNGIRWENSGADVM
ncbi:hypothetical protein V8G54_004337 [Vigna mungo]|uniref:GRF-type domain-containing protein n=1 Tax=Vigna mungo TaxID=3915 RepID=A0AAQ3PG10_VIGMU